MLQAYMFVLSFSHIRSVKCLKRDYDSTKQGSFKWAHFKLGASSWWVLTTAVLSYGKEIKEKNLKAIKWDGI